MILETWIAVIILAFVGVIGIICSLGWLATEQILEKERERNDQLMRDKERLEIENARANFKLNLIRAKIEMEMNK